jgi:hypothetical protein
VLPTPFVAADALAPAQAALQVARLTLLEAEKRLKQPADGALAPEAFDVSYGWCARARSFRDSLARFPSSVRRPPHALAPALTRRARSLWRRAGTAASWASTPTVRAQRARTRTPHPHTLRRTQPNPAPRPLRARR